MAFYDVDNATLKAENPPPPGTSPVLGGAQTDFARNTSHEGRLDPTFDLLAEACLGAVADADLTPADIESAHIGNLASELFTGQAHLGAMVPAMDPAWSQLPSSRHEAACASGSIAILAAMSEIEAGRYDVVLVAGVEVMRNVPAADAARHLGSASWLAREQLGDMAWPAAFDQMASEIMDRWGGLTTEHLRAIVEMSRANALRNPLAQTREWDRTRDCLEQDDAANPVVVGKVRKSDCGRITDGAAAVILASGSFAREWHRARPSRPRPARIKGWGHRTASMSLSEKLSASRGEEYLLPHLKSAIDEAYARAGISGWEDLDLIETHDCFTITEYLAIDHFGVTPPGQAWQAVEDGRISSTGSVPINPSGGLLSLGHPVGATGVRILRDASRQVTGTAGETQVDGAKTVGTLNIGGSASTVVSFVVGQDDD